MIEVTISQQGIQIRGHAGYAAWGSDIVCSAVTALTQTFLQSVQELTGDAIKQDIAPGRADIDTRNLGGSAQLLADSFLLGLRMVAEEFPEYIRVTGATRRTRDGAGQSTTGNGAAEYTPGQRQGGRNATE